MRRAFLSTLVDLAEADPRIVLLTGDLGYQVIEPFAERVPSRFFNVGVAEQNMLGVATGLAEAGYIPFCYSITPFAALRPYEFFRNGAVHQRLPVRVVGVGGGFDYGHNGPSHYALEDLGVMRIQPGLAVIAPADHEQARAALLRTFDLPGPAYFRLGKDRTELVAGLDGRFALGRAQLVREGEDVLFLTTGSVTVDAMAAAERLGARGVSCAVMVVASLSPAPVEDLAAALGRFAVAISVEAHYVTGGLGSLVSEVIAERGLSCRLTRCGVHTGVDARVGSRAHLHQLHGLTSEQLAEVAQKWVRSVGRPRLAQR